MNQAHFIFKEGINGRLPNQDLLNSFQRIARRDVPVVLYDHLDTREHSTLPSLPSWLPNSLRNDATQAYAYQAKNVVRHLGYQTLGRPSGVHGLFHQLVIWSTFIFQVLKRVL